MLAPSLPSRNSKRHGPALHVAANAEKNEEHPKPKLPGRRELMSGLLTTAFWPLVSVQFTLAHSARLSFDSMTPGTHRRSHLYTMLPSRGKLLTPGQVEGLRALAEAYWQNRHPASIAPRPWEHDPVITRRGRARRARCIVRHAPTTLEAEYRLFRFCTLDLSARDL